MHSSGISNMDDLSMTLLDLVHNAIEAKAQHINIYIEEKQTLNRLSIQIEDDGIGMSQDMLENIEDPFFTTRKTRHVGLGIPFAKYLTDITAGSFRTTSSIGNGTTIDMTCQLDHVDLPPWGDITETLMTLFMHQADFDLTYHHITDDHHITIRRSDIMDAISGVNITHPGIYQAIRSYVDHMIKTLKGDQV